jgi:hypothetical protein
LVTQNAERAAMQTVPRHELENLALTMREAAEAAVLDAVSNGVIDMIHASKFDEAERRPHSAGWWTTPKFPTGTIGSACCLKPEVRTAKLRTTRSKQLIPAEI